ncbi:hypothetical protein AJ79_05428 [Helicocarpus griseus UAMH5409]|uniref:Heme oxygenase n=1 Tax=Helicocarpus griseus UAMH5409 TaxID=1447875 RepID=A0A2B7XNK1_9EURO|nr:hypothetical protein AJ79_05428 [Helicocarpus griseus UAMH5409]
MEDLATEIFNAIRDHHTSFGGLVSKRVPLCIPPRTDTPELYAFGISRFAEIYYAFEAAWVAQISELPDASGSSTPDGYEALDSFVNDDRGRVKSLLGQIYIPELLRSEKLRSDLRALGLPPRTEQSGQDGKDGVQGNAATAFAAHIRSAIEEHPHLIMVYSWIMYMALLNGGRRIRMKLAAAGHDFWERGTGPNEDGSGIGSKSGIPKGLSFWFFHADSNDLYDDEGIKQDFKRRLLSASTLLTIPERAQIIAEAVNIFRHCTRILAEIDVEVERSGLGQKKTYGSGCEKTGSGFLPSIKARLPAGMLRRRTSVRLQPVLVGIVGLLGGLYAWFLSVNGGKAQGMYGFWKAGNETEAGSS